MDVRQKVYDYLDEMNINYTVEEHEAVFTIEEVDKSGVFSKGVGCKNLFLRDGSGKRHFLLIAEEHTPVNIKEVQHQIGSSRLSFGSPERLMKYLGVEGGSVSPFGVLNDENCDVEVIFEKRLVGEKCLGFHPNLNTATVWLSFDDIKRVIEKHGNDIMYVDLQE